MMCEVVQIQPTLISLGADHAPHLFGKPWLAIGRESHHLVLVAVLGKTKELRERGIENAKRMREGDRASYFYLVPLPHSPHRAAGITEAVNRYNRCLLK